jgi:HflK protein
MITANEIASTIEPRGLLSSHELARLHRVAFLLAGLFIPCAVVFASIAGATRSILFAGLCVIFAWSGIVAVVHYLFLRFAAKDRSQVESGSAVALESKKAKTAGVSTLPQVIHVEFLPDFAGRWQWFLLFMGVIATLIVLPYGSIGALNGEAVTALRAAAVVSLVAGCFLYFLLQFAAAIQQRLTTNALDPLLYLARIAFLVSMATAGVTFFFLTTTRDISLWFGWPMVALTCVLVIETLLRFAARFYQPVALRDYSTPAGSSIILDALLGRGAGWKNAIKNFEILIGARIGELWILRFLGQIALPVLASTIICAWLATCLTAVPTGSRGVRVLLGRYQPVPLQPGLHLTWPWPFDQVEIIPTERVRSISLGFDKDLSGAVLWTEKHVEGEKNLLVGNGETLLTIDVPILYRIADPVAFLQTTSDPDVALTGLAERTLLSVTGSRDNFAIMTDARAEIAAQMKKALQAEVDRLGLGLEILFVGLKDIHPPVDVAGAYQEVISAAEQKERTIDEARAERAEVLPNANAKATQLKVSADATYAERVAGAAGKSARFTLVADAQRANGNLFRTRTRLDALDQVLAKPVKVIMGVPVTPNDQFYLDLRNTGELPPP